MSHPRDLNWHNMRLGQAAEVDIYNSTSLVGTQANIIVLCGLLVLVYKGNPKNTAEQKIRVIFKAELWISLP